MNNQFIPVDILDILKAITGSKGYIDEPSDMDAYVNDERGLIQGVSPLVLKPASTAEVAAIVRICNQANIGIVPQGGNTGLVGGSVPISAGSEVVLSLERMNKIRDIDATNYTMTVEAGCVLNKIQDAALEAGRFFPLSLAAEGSCQIGGNLSTNAGGTAVLQYGNARELVLGLEVVLPSGQVWNGLRRLRKDNTGYDLKQLFLGSEGTLVVITSAVLKLYPKPLDVATALVALRDLESAPGFLATLRETSGDSITAFEYMDRASINVLEEYSDLSDPFDKEHQHYALIELSSSRADAGLSTLLENVLEGAFDDGIVVDAVVASSVAQAKQLWSMRETLPSACNHLGACISSDISVPVSCVPEFVKRAIQFCEKTVDGGHIVAFGHIGDGNIHFSLMQPKDVDAEGFQARSDEINTGIYDIALELDGSFSAEHGVGTFKRSALLRYKSSIELDLMRDIKRTIDPNNIMNPGKVL